MHNFTSDHKIVLLARKHGLTLNLRWVRSADNKEAEYVSRSEKEDYVRLSKRRFSTTYGESGGRLIRT